MKPFKEMWQSIRVTCKVPQRGIKAFLFFSFFFFFLRQKANKANTTCIYKRENVPGDQTLCLVLVLAT